MVESSLPQSEPVTLPGPSSGRALRGVVGYGLLTALMIVTPMLVFVPAALLQCALRHGRRIAWAALIVASALLALYVMSVPGPPADVAILRSLCAGVLLAIALPTVAAAPLVERAEPFGRVLLFLLIGSAIGLAVTELGARALFSYSPHEAHIDIARQQGKQMVEMTSRGLTSGGTDFMRRWSEYYSTSLLPSMFMVQAALAFVLSLLMVGRLRAWHSAAHREAGSRGVYLFRNLSLPDWLLFAFVLGGLTPLATGLLHKVAANTLLLVVFLYVLQGLAIFRYLLLAMGAGCTGTMLGLMLLTLLTLTGAGPMLLGLAGLFDSFFDFRHFKKRKDDSHEGHTD